MMTLIFSARGFRWRIRRLDAEPLPGAPTDAPVTGLYFDGDDVDPRFLSLAVDSLPNDDVLAALPNTQLAQLLDWAQQVGDGAR